MYLRKIANTLNIPIFAVDYRLAPQFKYPTGLMDIIASIFWVKQFVKQVLGVEVKEYILMGDSAGANLAVSACHWLIESGIPDLPCMISLAYPVLDMRYFDYVI